MKPLCIDGQIFRVQFRHLRNISPKLGVRAITTCVIIGLYALDELSAIGNAICWTSDNFSRRTGRLKAFANALDHCGPLKEYRLQLFEQYMKMDPDRPHRVRELLPHAEVKRRWEAGWETRQARALKAATRDAAAKYYNERSAS